MTKRHSSYKMFMKIVSRDCTRILRISTHVTRKWANDLKEKQRKFMEILNASNATNQSKDRS